MVFPSDDPLAEWTATLAIAFNDLTLVHTRMEADHKKLATWFYWLRLGQAHFHEAAKYLDKTSFIEEVRDFVGSLPPEARSHYDSCLEVYRSKQQALRRLRNQAAFHYPELQQTHTQRPVRVVLQELAPETGQVEGLQQEVGGSRLLFADDVVSRVFVNAIGGEDQLEDFHRAIRDGITSFMRFTNMALDEWFLRAQNERGATFTT